MARFADKFDYLALRQLGRHFICPLHDRLLRIVWQFDVLFDLCLGLVQLRKRLRELRDGSGVM